VSHIIRAATHLPHALEERSNTFLARGPRVAMATTMTRTRTRGAERIRSIHGGTPRPGTEQSGSLLKATLETNSESLHVHKLTTHLGSRSPGLPVDQTLNILTIVGSHALESGPFQLLENEVTTINLPKLVGLAIEQQIPVIAPDTSIVSSLTNQILTEELGKSIVVEVHP
jgi:hypothetical protein